MPAALSYPGVYIEEIPSGVRTITGVATSITAFIGAAIKGPVNDPVVINSYADFERWFGSLGVNYPMSYAVRDFFLNGGGQGLIVRIFQAADATATATATPSAAVSDGKARLAIDDIIKLVAVSPGKWGRKLRASIEFIELAEVKTLMGIAAVDYLFNLTVRDSSPGGTTEEFRNLTVVPGPRRIDRVLESSSLIRLDGELPTTRPTKQDDPITIQEKIVADSKSTPAEKAAARQKIVELEDAMKASDGKTSLPASAFTGSEDAKTGLYALEKADLFNLLCIPPATRGETTDKTVYQAAMAYCYKRRAMLIVDSPAEWDANPDTAVTKAKNGLPELGLTGEAARNAALYFPRVVEADPNSGGQLDPFPPCGIIAGVMARTDATRGVWKAPAGLDAALNGVQALRVNLNDLENGQLNPLGINCLRYFPPVAGRVVWGARTMRGSDQLADEYKYVPVRRLTLFLEESLYRGLKWVVFEPNDEPLWSQIRLNVGAFMHNLFRPGGVPGDCAARSLLCQMRQGNHHPERHQSRHRQHRRRLCAAEAGRIRCRQDPADRRSNQYLRDEIMVQFSVNAQRFDPSKNFKFRSTKLALTPVIVAGVSKNQAAKPQAAEVR